MRHAEEWRPSKYVERRGRWRASDDVQFLSCSSWLTANLIVENYESALPRYARGRLVDLGCGRAPFYGIYKQFVTDVTLVDWQSSFHSNEHLDVSCDLNGPLPLQSASFDTVLLSDVLEHLRNPEDVCLEIARILAARGHLIMNVPFFYWLHEEPYDFFRYTEFALRSFIEKAGLEMVELRSIGGVTEIMADLGAKTVVRVPLVGAATAWALQRASWSIGRTAFGSKVRRATMHQMPLGYFLIAKKAA